MLRELADVISRPLLIIFESSWESKEVPEDSKTSIFKKDKKEDPLNYRLVSLTSVPWTMMGQTILENISKPIKFGHEGSYLGKYC